MIGKEKEGIYVAAGKPEYRWAISPEKGAGLTACAALLPQGNSLFCFGDAPTLADICLIPQIANARRFGVATEWDRLAVIEANCLAHPAFAETAPAKQPDFTAWTKICGRERRS